MSYDRDDEGVSLDDFVKATVLYEALNDEEEDEDDDDEDEDVD